MNVPNRKLHPAPAGLAPAERRIGHYGGSSPCISRIPRPPPGPSGRAAAAEYAKELCESMSSGQSLAPLGQAQRGRNLGTATLIDSTPSPLHLFESSLSSQ